MIKVIITAGGTEELIDEVRKITNNSSGRLGAIVANELYNEFKDNIHIEYVAPRKAIKPSIPDSAITYHQVTDTMSVANTLKEILKDKEECWVIHSMAISDYMVAEVRDKDGNALDRSKKISSEHEELNIKLVKTPKIINGIKEINPNAKLIGFKLLNKVSDRDLLTAACKQISNAKSDYVIANDLSKISATTHEAIVIKANKSKIRARLHNKTEIAKYIIKIIKGDNHD